MEVIQNQSETKNTLHEMKSTLRGTNNRVDEAEDPIGDLEGKEAENTHSEQQKEKQMKQCEDSISSLWDSFKSNATHKHRRRSLPSKTPQMPEMSYQFPSFGERTLC